MAGTFKGEPLDFTLKSVDELFPTPLLRFEVKNAADLNRRLLKEIAQRRAAEQGLKKSNRNGWHSDSDLFERKEPAQSALAQILLRIIAKSTRSFAPDADFNNIELLARTTRRAMAERSNSLRPTSPCRATVSSKAR